MNRVLGAQKNKHLHGALSERLIESFNHGLGQPSATLSYITERNLRMNVVSISRQSRKEAYQSFCGSKHMAVMQTISAECQGVLLLHGEIYHYIQLMSERINESFGGDFLPEMEEDTVCEVGNVILNAILRTISILTHTRLQCSLPSKLSADGIQHIFSDKSIFDSDVIVFDIESSWEENEGGAVIPCSVQLHLENNSHLQGWEAQVYPSRSADGK